MVFFQELYNKLFLSPYFFTIALRKRTDTSVMEDSVFRADHIMPAKRLRWVADPILVEDGAETYLFYESVIGTKGRIEVAQVLEDCSLSSPHVVLESEHHYSYPFVFRVDGDWYMIPETSSQDEVSLYRAECFPYEWKKKCVLLNQNSVDTTVFCIQGQWYLQTFLLCPGTEKVIPQVYTMDFADGVPVLSQISWPEYDSLTCRGAGPCFVYKGELYRPAQKSRAFIYGDGVLFRKIRVSKNQYREIDAGELTPANVCANVWLDGLHTYTQSTKYEAIDIRIRKFDPGKVFRATVQKVKRILR